MKRRGFALVLVLAILILITGIVLAFFSLAAQQRTIGSSSASRTKVHLLSSSALELIMEDLRQEIEAGSQAPDPGDESGLLRPILVPHAQSARYTVAPSMVPQNTTSGAVGNLVKTSKSAKPFYSMKPGYRALPDRGPEGPARASAISSAAPAAGGAKFHPRRWSKPMLMSPSEAAPWESGTSADIPDWIYLDRTGGNPTSFTASELQTMANPDPANTAHVIGRFSYLIYDVGGLIDINIVGNALDAAANARRGRLHQVLLDQDLAGIDAAKFLDFVTDWRSPVSSSQEALLFDPKRSFLDVETGDQAFVNRQDLLSFASLNSAALPAASLRFLTTFSPDRNAPHFEPNPDRPLAAPAAGEPTAAELNPSLLLTRFADETVLARGADPDVTVPGGTPVMPRRFPLEKLSLLADPDPDPDSLRYYFGLVKQGDQTWEYAAHQDGRIKRLAEVATEGREPNFFEILQAVIATDSLGKSGGNTMSLDDAKDSLRNLQIMRIGANIIDQWDADNLPTTLRYPSGVAGEFLELYGIENLPYISQVAITIFRPPHARNRVQAWAVFDVWNPHQNASTMPGDIQEFRIIPLDGEARITARYALQYGSFQFDELSQYNESAGGTLIETGYEDIVTLNAGRSLAFPSGQSYAEPTTVGGARPVSETDSPGLLLVDADLNFTKDGIPRANPAVPEKAQRSAALQTKLNKVMDAAAPYTASNSPSENSLGDRVYPAGTAITGLNPAYWSCTPAVPGSGTTDTPTTIYAKFGVKAHNSIIFYPNSLNPLSFALQARVNNQWRTIQKVEDIARRGSSGMNLREWRSNPSRMMENTHHSQSDALLTDCYYAWRGNGNTDSGGATGDSLIRFDPRSSRFGLSNTSKNGSGFSVRNASGAWDYQELWNTSGTMLTDRWMVTRGNYRPGATNEDSSGEFGFQFWFPGSNRVYTAPGGAVSNNPDVLNAQNPLRYADRDGVIRPADGYFGATPTVRGQIASRPVILNRPFRSVAEIGYAFRDLPWKTLDFATRDSADLGLLDVFSLDESPGADPLVAGKINLNRASRDVLAALIKNSANRLGDISPAVPETKIDAVTAGRIADAIVQARQTAPFRYVGDLVPRVFHSGGSDPLSGTSVKAEREAAIRTLAAIGTTRTWNLLIDLVVQSGRFSSSAANGENFSVQAQQRTWVHLSIDRLTGEVISMQKEVVDE